MIACGAKMTENLGGDVNERRATEVESVSQAERAAAVLGLVAMIVVVWGLTWLFTASPASSPKTGQYSFRQHNG